MKPPKKETIFYIGKYSNDWSVVTNEKVWKIIPNPYRIHDKDAVWSWNDIDEYARDIRFWDNKNKCTFNVNGLRKGISYDEYEKILPWNEPEWVKEARKYLED